MCGIVGIMGSQPVAPLIIEALKRLEYRGYDSSGVATLESGHLTRCRARGKLVKLQDKLAAHPLMSTIGIGHTRWATHGAPSVANAHPHATSKVALVHNGIIENFRELKDELLEQGVKFESETDTEVIVHLIAREINKKIPPKEAVESILGKLRGAFALAVIFEGEENLMIGARRGSPLVVGFGDNAMYLGSDAIALAPFTNRISYLDEGDWVVVTREGAQIYDEKNRPIERPVIFVATSSLLVDKGNHRHFMAKEIAEQPEVVGRTFTHYLDFSAGRAKLPDTLKIDFRKIDRLNIEACGTASYAAMISRYWFERFAHLPVDSDIGSEFRYRDIQLPKKGATIVVSQSGETADTLASMRLAKERGHQVIAIVNTQTSTMAREADFVLPTLAGTEIGVASTKAFTCQLAVLYSLAVAAGRARGVLSAQEEARLVRAASEVPRLMNEALRLSSTMDQIAQNLNGKTEHALFIGRGTSFPLALEGALKLKEISYIHAEGQAAGELKHGSIALVDKNMPVVVIAPSDHWFEKTVSNMQEVIARKGRIILLTDDKGRRAIGNSSHISEIVLLPEMPEEISPLVYAILLQLLAYNTAVHRGNDVDQPRNLAKSVTVE